MSLKILFTVLIVLVLGLCALKIAWKLRRKKEDLAGLTRPILENAGPLEPIVTPLPMPEEELPSGEAPASEGESPPASEHSSD